MHTRHIFFILFIITITQLATSKMRYSINLVRYYDSIVINLYNAL